jgi:carotenoid cleavage dioxygenase-like enzyme
MHLCTFLPSSQSKAVASIVQFQTYCHPDCTLYAVHFISVPHRNRFVRTPTFQAEQLAGRRMSRGLHDKGAADGSWLFNPLDLNVRSAANSSVLCWGSRLYALSDVSGVMRGEGRIDEGRLRHGG